MKTFLKLEMKPYLNLTNIDQVKSIISCNSIRVEAIFIYYLISQYRNGSEEIEKCGPKLYKNPIKGIKPMLVVIL